MSDWNPEHMPAFDDDKLCWRPPEANEWQALREDSEELARRADRIRALEAEVEKVKRLHKQALTLLGASRWRETSYRGALERIEALGSGEAVRIARAALESSDE